MRKVKRFLIRREPEQLWLRHEFRLLGMKELEDFVIQFEVTTGDRRLTPVRYDAKHDYIHRDIIDRDGSNVEKEEICASGLEEAVKACIDDLAKNWVSHLKKGGYDDLLTTLTSLPIDKMEVAKQFMVDLIRHPEKIDETPNVVDLTLKPEISTFTNSLKVTHVKGESGIKN